MEGDIKRWRKTWDQTMEDEGVHGHEQEDVSGQEHEEEHVGWVGELEGWEEEQAGEREEEQEDQGGEARKERVGRKGSAAEHMRK